MSYQTFKSSVINTIVGDGQCVALIVNNPRAYIEYLFPGVSWPSIIPPVEGAKDMAGKGNGYLQWVVNDHNNANQLPVQGDIMVFGATPQAGYSNTFVNPYGHTGVCESANNTSYALLQQNSPTEGAHVNVTSYPWRYRPCLGWYHPIIQVPKEINEPTPPTPTPTPVPTPIPTPTPEPTPTPIEPSQPPVETPAPTPDPIPSPVEKPQPPLEAPATPETPPKTPKVIVPDPSDYFRLWELFVVFCKRLWKSIFRK